jgi:hypothetical protein
MGVLSPRSLDKWLQPESFVASNRFGIPYAVPSNVSAAGKTLQKMRKSQTGWRIEELQAVADENSVSWRRPGHGGSHVIFSASGVREIVSVPAKRPIKPVYITQFLALIDSAVEFKQNEPKNKARS